MKTNDFLTASAMAFGIALLALPAHADDAMSGMAMPAASASGAASLTVQPSITPNPPKTGGNALDLQVTGADGRPMTGLKLSGSVAMTSMDMGTTHPTFIDAGNGHYKATVTFSMDGLWRVTVREGKSKLAEMNFESGGKTSWKSPPINASTAESASVPSAASTTPATSTMPGMETSVAAVTDKMGTMDMMKTAVVPELQEKATYVATGNEDWKMHSGFGRNAPMVAMMNKMMVGGSGMEGMKMPAMKMDFGAANYTGTKDEDDSHASGTTTGTENPAGTSDSMAGMDMGATSPSDAKTGSNASAKGSDRAMPGIAMPPSTAASAAPQSAASSAPLKITASISNAKAGDNAMRITIADAQGKPVPGAKISTTVVMTSMDMGTTHPAVREMGNGKYASTVSFTMAGPWRVRVKVTVPGQKPVSKAFDFSAK